MYTRALTFEKFLQVVREVPVVREVLTHFPLPHSPHTFSGIPTLSVCLCVSGCDTGSLSGSLYKAEQLGFIYVLFCFLDFHFCYLSLCKAEHLGFICAYALSHKFYAHLRRYSTPLLCSLSILSLWPAESHSHKNSIRLYTTPLPCSLSSLA